MRITFLGPATAAGLRLLDDAGFDDASTLGDVDR
ncbi:hypothetical protein BH11MYX3_BH11MYX3_38220 [soil metagenome]